MARIDFYILPDTTLEARLQFACKLAETIWRKGYRLHLHCEETALLNLHPDIPEGVERYARIAEIINQHQQVLVAKRTCWQRYKEMGHEVVPHKLG